MKNSLFDPRPSLNWKFDAVHGHIDISDPLDSSKPGTIAKILKLPILERLRRIKQLGFASQSYPSADHSRYSHALGTMHMMRTMLTHLDSVGALKPELYDNLRQCFPADFKEKSEETKRTLFQHMLIAALLQDCGELPFSQATKHIYEPSNELRESLKKKVSFEISDLSNKDIFTTACLYNEEIASVINKLSKPFLVFLITGKIGERYNSPKNLYQLRHMMNGVVDPDRLDYVFRDAYHTIGGPRTPSTVIESLLYIDKDGPVFSDPGPVSSFLAMRAHLCSTVYSTPASRFQFVLLFHFLKGVKENDLCSKAFFGPGGEEGIGLEDFLQLDDISISSRIKEFYESDRKNLLKEKAHKALKLILTPSSEYHFFWLPRQREACEKLQAKKMNLPDDLYFDTLADFHYRQLYLPDSVRIEAHSLVHYGLPMSLEKCGGPFIPMFRGGWSISPMQESILLFTPHEEQQKDVASWIDFHEALRKNCLYDYLIKNDPIRRPTDTPPDTTKMEGFEGPKIFISFASEDEEIVNRIVKILYDRNKRYLHFAEPFQGDRGHPIRKQRQCSPEL